MSKYVIEDSTLTGIADAIRGKTGGADPITVSDMAAQIAGITTGGGGSVEGVHFVTFKSEDGTTELFKRPVADGDNCADPVARGLIDAPTKESTDTQTFAHSGWSDTPGGSADASILNAVTADKTVYAAFTASTRYYTIRFFDGETLLHTVLAEYGSIPEYVPEKENYLHTGWEPELVAVTGDNDYYAQWEESVAFAATSWEKIAEISEAGKAASVFAIGDKKTFTMTFADGTTEDGELRIIGFNHDDLADGSGQAGITIELVGVVEKLGRMKHDSTSNPPNTMLSTSVLPYLPQELRSALKTVKKYTSYANESAQIFALSWKEVGWNTSQFYFSEPYGKKYDYYDSFTTGSVKAVKNLKDGTAVAWGLRSRYNNNDSSRCYIKADGTVASGLTSTAARYYSFAICI